MDPTSTLSRVIPFPTDRLAAHTADRVRWLSGQNLRAVVDLLDRLAVETVE
jgi:hypothetical protein